MEGLSINNVITNEDIIVTYTPSVINYSYVIVKDSVYNTPVYINDGSQSQIILKEEGTYNIEVTENGVKNIGEYIIDKTPPVISIEEKTYTITTKEIFDYKTKIKAEDSNDGDVSEEIVNNIDTLDFTSPGIKKVEFSVSDKAGNITTDVIYVTVKKDNSDFVLFGQISIIMLVLMLVLFLAKYIRSIKLEKRFSKFTVQSSKNKSISLFDNLDNQYNIFITKISKHLKKNNFINKTSEKYKKYVDAFNFDANPVRVVVNKIVIGILFVLGFIMINLFRSIIVQPLEFIIPFVLGFYLLDVIYIYKYSLYRRKIEHDLIDAITIMNNSFKSGKSIIQAIDMVGMELDGPISKEFKKISSEINLGLDIEVAFRRFSNRVKIEEAVYLTSSLSILNKTGGNIIKVFNSIEKSLFAKKKLREELKALTSSSKMITYILIFIPIIFAIFLNVINVGFFEPLFTTELGIILLTIIIILYIAYIVIVRKVMKVGL